MVVLNKNILTNILIPKISNLNEIQKYISKFWKKNHILSKNKKLFLWQHSFNKKKIDFIIKRKGKKIISVLGFINQSRDKIYSSVSLAIWHSVIKNSGIDLMFKLFNSKTINLIKATTISRNVIKIYKLLGFKVQYFNQYYLTCILKKKQKISKNLIKNQYEFKKIPIKKLLILDIKKIKLSKKIKNKKYLKWRFINHPIYKYKFVADNNYKLILIFRIIKIKNLSFIRVVDFIGSFKNKKVFIKQLYYLLEKNNFHHLEFLHFGYEDKNILRSGFKKIKKKQILPLYTQPFEGLKSMQIICGYKFLFGKERIKLVRADGDLDRPV